MYQIWLRVSSNFLFTMSSNFYAHFTSENYDRGLQIIFNFQNTIQGELDGIKFPCRLRNLIFLVEEDFDLKRQFVCGKCGIVGSLHVQPCAEDMPSIFPTNRRCQRVFNRRAQWMYLMKTKFDKMKSPNSFIVKIMLFKLEEYSNRLKRQDEANLSKIEKEVKGLSMDELLILFCHSIAETCELATEIIKEYFNNERKIRKVKKFGEPKDTFVAMFVDIFSLPDHGPVIEFEEPHSFNVDNLQEFVPKKDI